MNEALDHYIELIKARTLPTLHDNQRLLPADPPDWLLNRRDIPPECGEWDLVLARMVLCRMRADPEFTNNLGPLFRAWEHLREAWPAIIDESRRRLGDRFHPDDYPDATEVWKHFIVWGDFSGHDLIDTHSLLGCFSMFHPPDPTAPEPPDIFESVAWGKKLEALQSERGSAGSVRMGMPSDSTS